MVAYVSVYKDTQGQVRFMAFNSNTADLISLGTCIDTRTGERLEPKIYELQGGIRLVINNN